MRLGGWPTTADVQRFLNLVAKNMSGWTWQEAAGRPIFRGLFEDNDPRKRLQMIVNYNTDISQFWEWSGRGLRPVDETNEAYKLGVNYIMYGMTH